MSATRVEQLRERALGIGADPGDSSDERFRKRLLVGIALIILPAGLALGLPLLGRSTSSRPRLRPWGYVTGSIVSLAVFARTRSFAFLRTAQLLLILVVPALGMIMLGGLDESSCGDPLVAPRTARRSRLRPPEPRLAVVRGLRRHDPALARSRRGRSAGRRRPAGRLRPRPSTSSTSSSSRFVAMLLLVTLRARTRRRAGARRGAPPQRPPGARSPSACSPTRTRSRTTSTMRASSSPTSSTSRRSRAASTRARSSASSTGSSRRFDELVDRYEVEKIKTIGDCYMVAAGVPRPSRGPRAGARRSRARDARRARDLPPESRATTSGSGSGSAPARSSPA